METHLLILLLITIGSALCMVAGVSMLLWRGHQAATLRAGGRLSPAMEKTGLITWNEATTLGVARQKTLTMVRKAFTKKLSSIAGVKGRWPMPAMPVVDPVDGTAFQQGETIVRCVCGTNYHQHSWQWIGEKNHAKCVNCKRPGPISTYTLPGPETLSSAQSFASARR